MYFELVLLFTIGESYDSFVHKRALVKYQSQSELDKVMMLYVHVVSHLKNPLNFDKSNS